MHHTETYYLNQYLITMAPASYKSLSFAQAQQSNSLCTLFNCPTRGKACIQAAKIQLAVKMSPGEIP